MKYPSFSLFDVGTSYNLKLNEKQSFVFGVNVYNIFNKYYISDARTSTFAKQLSDFKDIQGGQSAQQQFDAYQKRFTGYRPIQPSVFWSWNDMVSIYCI